MIIDLRSDTLTRPTPAMREAMFAAEVGDDVFGEDPSVNALEKKIADLFGMEEAVFCPSGTMCNQIAIRIATRPQDQMICYESAHVYLYEGGGAAYNSGVTARLMSADRGIMDAAEVEAQVNPVDVHFPKTSLVCIENTVNKGGGSCYTLDEIAAIREVCTRNHLHLHMDGARIFNAMVATGQQATQIGTLLDTLSVCFSKGLGAPVGSALLGSREMMHEARRVRKVFGGGMRQAGFLAAAASFALDHQVDRLADDHRRASRMGKILGELNWVEKIYPIETNIVIFEPVFPIQIVMDALAKADILSVPFGRRAIRLVTHLDITDEMMDAFEAGVKKISLT